MRSTNAHGCWSLAKLVCLHVPLVQHLCRKTLPQGGCVGQSWVFLPGTMCWAQVFPCSSTLCQQWYHPDAPLWRWGREVSIPGQRGTSTVPVVHQVSFCPYVGGEGRDSVRGGLVWLPHLRFGCWSPTPSDHTG